MDGWVSLEVSPLLPYGRIDLGMTAKRANAQGQIAESFSSKIPARGMGSRDRGNNRRGVPV